MSSTSPQPSDPPIAVEVHDSEEELSHNEEFRSRLAIDPIRVVDPLIRRLHDGMTVAELIQLSFPDAAIAGVNVSAPPTFSSVTPMYSELSWVQLQKIPLPSIITVDDLLHANVGQWKQGARSVAYCSIHFPFAILTCWQLIHGALASSRAWRRSFDWASALLSRSGPAGEGIGGFISDTIQLANSLRWNGFTGIDGHRVDNGVLAEMLSDEWASSDIIDLFLMVLRHDMLLAPQGSSLTCRLLPVDTTTKISFLSRDGEYLDNSSTRHVRTLGSDLATGIETRCGGIFHVHGNHWVVAVVDTSSNTILYADSMAVDALTVASSDAVQALTWWIAQHGLNEFSPTTLPITSQADGFSCGILSFASLANFVLPAVYPPLPSGTYHASLARMAMFQRVVSLSTRTADRFPDVWCFASTPRLVPATSISATKSTERRVVIPAMFQIKSMPSRKRLRTSEDNAPVSDHSDVSDVDTDDVASDASELTLLLLTKKEREARLNKRAKKRSKKTITRRKTKVPLAIEEVGIKPKVEDDESNHTPGPGRAVDQLLDSLTRFSGNTNAAGIRQWACAGKGCQKTWSGRTKGRVLRHAQTCSHLPYDVRMSVIKTMAANSTTSQIAASLSVETIKTEADDGTSPPPSSTSVTLVSHPIHLGDPAPPADTRLLDLSKTAGRQKLKTRVDDAVLRFWVAAGLPPSLFDYPEWKELCNTLNSLYAPLTRSAYTDHLLPSAQALVQTTQIAYLQTQRYLTLSYDGGTTRRQDGFYSFTVSTAAGEEFLVKMADGRGVAHTAQWIRGHACEVIDMIGRGRFAGVASDDTGNTRKARRLLVEDIKIVVNCQDPAHHLSNTQKNISEIDFFSTFIETLRKLITHFSHAVHDSVKLDSLRKEKGIGRGLVSIGNTRFATVTWAALSVRRCFECITELVEGEKIDLGPALTPFFRRSKRSRDFQLMLDRYIAVTGPIAKSIECIEGTSTTACDIFVFWIATIASIKDALENEDLDFPPDVCEQIRSVMNARWRQLFHQNDLYLTAFYLNPHYMQSDILQSPNQLRPTITVRGSSGISSSDRVPSGIRHPRTYLRVAKFLAKMAINEILYGDNPVFTQWASRPEQFQQELRNQFKAFSLNLFPWNFPINPNENMLLRYSHFRGVGGADLMAELAIKVYSIRPHSIADERVASSVTWVNSGRRARMQVGTIFAQVQVRQWYANERKKATRRRASPTVKFYDLDSLLYSKPLDGSEGSVPGEDFDEPADQTVLQGAQPAVPVGEAADDEEPEVLTPVDQGAMFDVEDVDSEVNLRSVELQSVLADFKPNEAAPSASRTANPVIDPKNPSTPASAAISFTEDAFHINDWT